MGICDIYICMLVVVVVVRTSKRSRGSKFVMCGSAGQPRMRDSVAGHVHELKRIHVYTMLNVYSFGFATSIGSSQNREQWLRCRRERERTHHVVETAEQMERSKATTYRAELIVVCLL